MINTHNTETKNAYTKCHFHILMFKNFRLAFYKQLRNKEIHYNGNITLINRRTMVTK